MNMGQVDFGTLKASAKIFEELESGRYPWWDTLKNERQFYCEVRKDNQVNVYFEGGSVARLHYCSRHKVLQAFTHRKYLGLDEGQPMYVECASLLSPEVNNIVSRIKKNYSRKKGDGKESWSEKYIQSQLIIKNRDRIIDSEFAYKADGFDIRVDLVELVKGELRFIELKRIGDDRMLLSTDENPEIIGQMKSYEAFLKQYGKEILQYYVKLYDIKKALGITVPRQIPTRINTKPFLLIFNNWEKAHPARDRHILRMNEILRRENVDFSITEDFCLEPFESREKRRQMKLIHDGFFGKTRFNGPWTIDRGSIGKEILRLPFIMDPSNSVNNLFDGIREGAMNYFGKYGIEWWNQSVDGYCPPGHLLSSQVHCINHLFALRNDAKALLDILNHATHMQFDDVLPTMIDEDGYLSFEFAYMNKELLGENDHGAGRGTRCTSVDAFMIARKGDRKVLIPIEWKYTESYKWQDKTIAKRLARYEQLIESSSQLISPENGIPHSIYFYEPCYELMRQTLLAEQMVRKGVADDFIHINVVPARNTEYRNMVKYNYIPMLKKKQKFIPITPEELLAPLNNKIEYSALIQYLSKRYWA